MWKHGVLCPTVVLHSGRLIKMQKMCKLSIIISRMLRWRFWIHGVPVKYVVATIVTQISKVNIRVKKCFSVAGAVMNVDYKYWLNSWFTYQTRCILHAVFRRIRLISAWINTCLQSRYKLLFLFFVRLKCNTRQPFSLWV